MYQRYIIIVADTFFASLMLLNELGVQFLKLELCSWLKHHFILLEFFSYIYFFYHFGGVEESTLQSEARNRQ